MPDLSYDSPMHIQEVFLRETRLNVRKLIPNDVFTSPRALKLLVRETAQGMSAELTAYLMSTKPEVVTEQWAHSPANWWEHLRERWAPKWWLRRHPVRYHNIRQQISVVHVCPHIELPDGNLRHEMCISFLDRPKFPPFDERDLLKPAPPFKLGEIPTIS